MNDIKLLIRLAGAKMVPFIKTVTLYFLFLEENSHGQIFTTLLKCAPVVCLMIFVLLQGVHFEKGQRYSLGILLGLIFSCAGDALLNYDLFPHGMGAFALAQISYISSFGLRPFKLWIGIILYIFGATCIIFLHKSLESILLIGLPVYAFLLLTMSWRALAQVGNKEHRFGIVNRMCGIGSVLFVISDGLIAFDKFYTPIPYRTILIMATYYAAQFGITMSIMNVGKLSRLKGSSGTTNDNRPNIDQISEEIATVRQRR